jgi:hypothetical protein
VLALASLASLAGWAVVETVVETVVGSLGWADFCLLLDFPPPSPEGAALLGR